MEQGARGRGQEITSSDSMSIHSFFLRLSNYSLAPCSLPLAPNETEQAELAKLSNLRKSFYFTILDGDTLGLWTLGQSWHTNHVASNGDNHLTTAVQDDVADADSKALR